MAGRDLSRYRIMASYVLNIYIYIYIYTYIYVNIIYKYFTYTYTYIGIYKHTRYPVGKIGWINVRLTVNPDVDMT